MTQTNNGFAPGMVIRLAPRYDGNSRYAHDNGTGEILVLQRRMIGSNSTLKAMRGIDANDWYCGPEGSDDWSFIVHEQRLEESEILNGYCTVLIPWSEHPTQWHPTEKEGPFSVLTRGANKTVAAARKWSDEHLESQPYTLRFCECDLRTGAGS